MDNNITQMSYTSNFIDSHTFGFWNGIQPREECKTDGSLRFDSGGASNLCDLNTKERKKTWTSMNGIVGPEPPSLVLDSHHLSCLSDMSKLSPTSLSIISSLKESDEESSVDPGLNLQLSLGNGRMISSLKPASPTGNVLNLKLSLSTARSESCITSVESPLHHHQNDLENVALFSPILSNDAGSASSCLIFGSYLQPAVDTSFTHSSSPCSKAIGMENHSAPSESCIISVESPMYHHQNDLENVAPFSPILSNDVGSASSCLIFGSYLQPTVHNSLTHSSSLCSNEIGMENHSDTVVPDLPSTLNQKVKSPVACTSGVIHIQQRSGSTRKCQFQGCEKGARGASGFCIAHGGGRRCQKPGCQKGAEGRTIFCKAHGGGRRCEFLGCTKSAEGRTDYCIAHGGGRRCSENGCSRAARGKSGLCIRHGGGKRCQKEDCTKSAEGHSGLCISHGGGRRCHYPQCSKGAQGSTLFCKAHGGGKRCTFLGCNKGAEGSTPFCKGHGGGKRCSFQGGGVCPKSVHGGTQFCVAHGGGKRCAIPDCTKSARGRTSFCVRHGGGRRCISEGCDKSAQGSTDFCKAHGGGKRCSWGQAGSQFGTGELPCDRLPRSKSTLCTEHSALIQDHRIHGGGTLVLPVNQCANIIKPEMMKEVTAVNARIFPNMDNDMEGSIDCKLFDTKGLINPLATPRASLPEGRVHGGSLIAMLTST